MKLSANRHKLLQWLERELCAVLAVGIIGLGGVLAMADSSSVVTTSLTITEAPATPVTPPTSGGGGAMITPPFISDVQPSSFVNTTDMILDVTGLNFEYNTVFKLGTSDLRMLWSGNSSRVRLRVPRGFKPGRYVLAVYNSDGRLATWDKQVEVKGMYYAAALLNQSNRQIKLTVGQTVEVWVDFVNTGTEPWLTYSRNTTRLGTAQPRDRKSVFWRSSWVLRNRPANVQKVGFKGRQAINPTETGRFTFKAKAPNKPGNYVEYFSPVTEYIQWMDATVSWEMVVTAKPTTKAPTTSQPTVGSKSVSWPTSSLPEGPMEFYDGVESWLRSFSNFFSRLVGGLMKM